jgi:hypothetical protein
MIPGTSCLATIVLSLRNKNHAPIEAPRIILALTGLQTWAKFFGPFGLRIFEAGTFAANTQHQLTDAVLSIRSCHRLRAKFFVTSGSIPKRRIQSKGSWCGGYRSVRSNSGCPKHANRWRL